MTATFDHRDEGTDETVWDRWLQEYPIPALNPAELDLLVVVAAHPDDETLGAGGLIAAATRSGTPVRVIVATDGDASHPDSPTHPPQHLATLRRQEVGEAIAILAPGTTVEHLGLADGGLAEASADLVAALTTTLDGLPANTLIVTPWARDRHPDHEAVAAAVSATRPAGRVLHYPIWAWHWGEPQDLTGAGELFRVELTEIDRAAKTAAMACHRSQIAPLSDAPGDETLLSSGVLAHFDRPVEIFLAPSEPDRPTDGNLSPEYFDRLYRESADPWGLADRWYEQRKRGILLAALPRPRFRRAFEPGCANGDLTAELVQRCSEVIAMDPAPVAVERVRERFASNPVVRPVVGSIPLDFPDGDFDLIVLSEVAYYCGDTELIDLVRLCTERLAPDGVLVLCHWRHPAPDHPQTAEGVHAAFSGADWVPLAQHREEDFLLDVLVRPPARSVARATGVIAETT